MDTRKSHGQNMKTILYILCTLLFLGVPTLLLGDVNPQEIPGGVYAAIATLYAIIIAGIGEHFKSRDSKATSSNDIKEEIEIRRIETELDVFTQLLILLKNNQLVPANRMQPDYKNLAYDCPCGEQHILSQTRYLLCASPVKFFFLCENKICTLVRVKGIVRQTAISEWFTEAEYFKSALGKLREINDQF